MIVEWSEQQQNYRADFRQAIELTRPVRFDGRGATAFGASLAHSEPFVAGSTPLSVARGAGCNCPLFHFAAHLHGTHTEGVGHLTREGHRVQEIARIAPVVLARLVSLPIEEFGQSGETYGPHSRPSDPVVTARALKQALPEGPGCEALVLKTGPNGDPPAYLTTEAMKLVVEWQVLMLLLELPSVDRAEDGGRLSNHRLFWGLGPDSDQVAEPSEKSITELLQVPPGVKDGFYALSVQLAPVLSDATPSRAILYPLL